MPKLKVLPLEPYMEYCAHAELPESLHETCITFNRPGIYLRGEECWYETPQGRAFTYDPAQFRHTLSLLDAERLNLRQVAALTEFCNQGLANKDQWKLYHLCNNVIELRITARQCRLDLMRLFIR